MSSAPRYNPHYTVADYQQWDGDWELWNGVAVAMTPSPSFEHQRLATRLTYLIESALRENAGCHCAVVHETDWHIADDMVVRPDVCVVCEPVTGLFITKPPALVAEVLSPSTHTKDTGAKAQLYARQGVRYYLLLDPIQSICEVLHLIGDQYGLLSENKSDIFTLTLHEGCALRIDTAELFESE